MAWDIREASSQMKMAAAFTGGRQWLAHIAFVALCMTVGSLAAWATAGAVDDWYRTIAKPDWTPPDWAFGPAWTVLYIAMGVAAGRVWQAGGGWRGPARTPLIWFFIQLAFNAGWSFAFFAARSPLLGLIEVVPFWLSIAVTGWLFWKTDRIAGLLFIPYIAWVSFAAALNLAIWLMN
jgi:translocator protein